MLNVFISSTDMYYVFISLSFLLYMASSSKTYMVCCRAPYTVMILWLIEKNVRSVPVIEIALRCFDSISENTITKEKQNGFQRVGCVINATMLFLIDFF